MVRRQTAAAQRRGFEISTVLRRVLSPVLVSPGQVSPGQVSPGQVSPGRILPLLVLGLTSVPCAQQPVPIGPQAAPPANGSQAAPTDQRTFLDSVLMTVDNKVILASEVEAEFRAQLKQAEQNGQTIDNRVKAQIYQRARLGFLRAAVRAQSAWTIPGSTPDRIQKIVDSELKKRQQREIDDFGSLNKMKQEMGIMGHNHFIVERRKREQILTELAQQDFTRRFRDRLTLMITPKDLRAHYAKRRAELKAPARADVALIRFAGSDPTATRARAEKAAAAWRGNDRSSASIAEEFQGSPLPDQIGVEARSGKLLPFIQEFVAAARSGKVSAPISSGSSFYVLKITRLQAAVEFAWSDPAVQAKLREELVTEEYNRILVQLNQERAKSLKIWPAQRTR